MGLKKPAHLRVNRLHYKSRKKDNDGPKYHFLRFSKNADAEVDTFHVTLQIRYGENESSSVQLTIPLRPGMTIGEAKLEIAHTAKIPPEQLHLYARHHLLLQKDDSTLSELDIQEGATLLVRQGAFMDLELASTALDVPTDAKEDEIRKASKKLSVKLHPDKYEDDAEKKEAGEQFKVVQYAMRFMIDNLCGSKLALIIRRSNSSNFTLNMRSSHTISDVKDELSEMECVSSDKLCMLFDGQLLEDDHTLSDYNIANEDTLDLVKNRSIQIFVKISGGDTISLGATLTTPIASLKDMISEKVGIAKTEQRLCYGAKQLDDPRTLIEYNIYEECTLDLLGRVRGGNPYPDGNHISEDSSSTTNEMPPPPPTELISSHVVSSRGIYSHESGDCISIKGSWALGLDILENPQGERNEFLYKRHGTGSSQEIPQSGTYTGSFVFNAKNQNGMVEQITVTDEVQLEFIENNKGFYNVGGNGYNQFGSYTVAGTLKESLFTINRTFSAMKMRQDEVDLPSRPVRKRKLNVRLSDDDFVLDVDEPEQKVINNDVEEYVDIDIADPSTAERAPKRSRRSWEDSFAKLLAYKEQHGDTNVPQSYEDQQLAMWVKNTRAHYRKMQQGEHSPSLTDERVAQLEEAGFNWGSQNISWEVSFAKLLAYKEQHGDTNVPQSYEDKHLAHWVKNTRAHYRKMQQGEHSPSLTDERVAQLEEAGFNWGSQNNSWEDSFAKLLAYKEQHGDTNVPRSYEDKQLANWVMNNRTDYRMMQQGEPSPMTDEHVAQLEEEGFVWDVRANIWNIHYQKLVKYKEVHGTTKVSARHDLKLHRWATTQREKYALLNEERKSLLEPDKAKLLHEIGFDFYRRERSKQVHRIEWKFMHELVTILEEFGYTWFSLDRVYEDLTYRPDGVIHVVVESSVIFVEVDERGHNPSHPSYTPLKEQTRMKALKDVAMRNGKVSVVFIRVNTGNLSEVLPQQVETVREVLASIHSSKPKGYHVNYVDYRDDHVHVLESEKKESGIDSVKKFHTENFDEKVRRIRASDLR